jgi:hypothetical protein
MAVHPAEQAPTSRAAQQQNLAWEWIKGMQAPSVMTHVTSLMHYLPTKPAVIAQYLKGGPEYTGFAKETATAWSRTTQYGANYPKVWQALWTAIQAAITGTSSVSSALPRRNPLFPRYRRSREAEPGYGRRLNGWREHPPGHSAAGADGAASCRS